MDFGQVTVNSKASINVLEEASDMVQCTIEIIEDDGSIGDRFVFYNSLLIGRSLQCDLKINDKFLSRKHVHLFADEAGRMVIKNLSSIDGTTLINGIALQPKSSLFLHDMDVITLSDKRFRWMRSSKMPATSKDLTSSSNNVKQNSNSIKKLPKQIGNQGWDFHQQRKQEHDVAEPNLSGDKENIHFQMQKRSNSAIEDIFKTPIRPKIWEKNVRSSAKKATNASKSTRISKSVKEIQDKKIYPKTTPNTKFPVPISQSKRMKTPLRAVVTKKKNRLSLRKDDIKKKEAESNSKKKTGLVQSKNMDSECRRLKTPLRRAIESTANVNFKVNKGKHLEHDEASISLKSLKGKTKSSISNVNKDIIFGTPARKVLDEKRQKKKQRSHPTCMTIKTPMRAVINTRNSSLDLGVSISKHIEKSKSTSKKSMVKKKIEDTTLLQNQTFTSSDKLHFLTRSKNQGIEKQDTEREKNGSKNFGAKFDLDSECERSNMIASSSHKPIKAISPSIYHSSSVRISFGYRAQLEAEIEGYGLDIDLFNDWDTPSLEQRLLALKDELLIEEEDMKFAAHSETQYNVPKCSFQGSRKIFSSPLTPNKEYDIYNVHWTMSDYSDEDLEASVQGENSNSNTSISKPENSTQLKSTNIEKELQDNTFENEKDQDTENNQADENQSDIGKEAHVLQKEGNPNMFIDKKKKRRSLRIIKRDIANNKVLPTDDHVNHILQVKPDMAYVCERKDSKTPVDQKKRKNSFSSSIPNSEMLQHVPVRRSARLRNKYQKI